MRPLTRRPIPRPGSGWRAAAVVLILLVSGATAHAEKAIVIGGGPSLEESQGQIEQNVLWLQRLLPELGYDVDMYFGIGNAPGEDVVFSSHSAAALADPYYALDLVFGDPGAMPVEFKHHEVANVLGSTRERELRPALERTLRTLPEGESLLLVFNGHGGEGKAGDRDNTMNLWEWSEISVDGLDRILDAAPADATIRFVMPQCFSGGFAKLMYAPTGKRRPAAQTRCGFMSQAADRPAEGCQLGIEDVEYRDYTTYLFAALGGRARHGAALASDPDLDHDGRVSFREAHWYTLRTALSYDLSRSTSEVFLEDWAPRRLRWASVEPSPSSVYLGIARDIAARHGWTLDARSLKRTLAALKKETRTRQKAKNRLGDRIEAVQAPLRRRLQAEWPFLKGDYDKIDWSKHDDDAEDIGRFLRGREDFADLRSLTRDYGAAERAELEAERLETQVEKVQRMLRLARLERLFDVHATPAERDQMRRLVACESGTPPASAGQNSRVTR